MNETEQRLRSSVKRIANEISYPDEYNEWWKEWLSDNPDEGYTLDDTPNAWAYMQDVLDIEYTISGSGEYLGAQIAVGLGGPNIYINTRNGRVEGYWGGDEFSWSFTDKLGIDDYCEEMYQCIAG